MGIVKVGGMYSLQGGVAALRGVVCNGMRAYYLDTGLLDALTVARLG